ncbi:hypothetical protein WN51_13983 [Melipona quadrifasciata]|uniref:Uncharacterized protein n=1 Tax=Melipona quadrifasciata TaxID=166423 RepID=A0A0M8ZYV4_9HYME|nr:hypothetical protein WN51_13983 [Melipona quadrifasciata]
MSANSTSVSKVSRETRINSITMSKIANFRTGNNSNENLKHNDGGETGKLLGENSEFIRWSANVKGIFAWVGSVIKYSPVSSAEHPRLSRKYAVRPAVARRTPEAPPPPFLRYHLKAGDVMTTIRAEDDMALVSSTMARVFVNRWLLMTGRTNLLVVSLLSQPWGTYSLRNVLGKASVSALCLIIQVPTRRNTPDRALKILRLPAWQCAACRERELLGETVGKARVEEERGPMKRAEAAREMVGTRATVETSRTMVRSCDVDVVEDDGAAIGNGGDGGGADGGADTRRAGRHEGFDVTPLEFPLTGHDDARNLRSVD